jgi:hypothetical protein
VSQGGINTKVEVDIVVLPDVEGFNYPEIRLLRDLFLREGG